MPRGSDFTRRNFFGTAAAGVASGLLAGCSTSTATPNAATSSLSASTTPVPVNAHVAAPNDTPEMPDLKFGIIALTDCSPLVIAHEKGLFKKYGIAVAASRLKIPSLRDLNEAHHE